MQVGSASDGRCPNLEIGPADALIDSLVSIRLSDLAAEQLVTLHAEMADYLNCVWASQASFVADRRMRGCR